MAKLSLELLASTIATYVDETKISVATFNETRNNTAALLDKIAKVFTIDTSFTDKLTEFEGEELPLGKTIEEWQADLILPEDYDSTGSGALAPHRSTFRPNFYSETLGRKKIPQTIDNDDLERAVNNYGEFNSLIAIKSKRIYDSVAVWRYGVKRELLAKLIKFCEDAHNPSTTYAAATSYTVGTQIKTTGHVGIVVKPITGGAADTSTWAKCVSAGYIVEYDLVTEINAPVDAETGEAFIKQVKCDVEVAQDISEGHSLNGNTIGAAEGLILIVKQGIIPAVEVDVLAGAFHQQNVAFPADVKVIKDFGSNNTGVFAVLVDRRGVKLHNTYKAVRENLNGDGDFLNLFYHSEDTAFISRNVFVRVYKKPAIL